MKRHSPNVRSNFSFVSEGDVVWIVDKGGDYMSVTNDAERVVSYLWYLGYKGRFVYRDSEGRWDELAHRDGVFMGFRFLGTSGKPASTREEARTSLERTTNLEEQSMSGQEIAAVVTWRKLPSGDEEATIETGFGGLYLHVGGKEDGIAQDGSVPAWAGISRNAADLFVDLRIIDGIAAGTIVEAKRLIVSAVHERFAGILAQLTRLAAITR